MEKVKVFFGENAEQDPLYKLLNNSVQTTKYSSFKF